MDVVDQPLRGVSAAEEQPERRIQPAAVEIRVEIAEARRQAAAHLPVGRRVIAPLQAPAAVAQAEQRVELLDQLGGEPSAAQRPDRDRVAGGRLG